MLDVGVRYRMTKQQQTKNCHWISRVLTEPWEVGERFLHFYDFNTRELARKSSRSLFSEDGINSQDVENWLGRMVETPFGNFRDKLAACDPSALDDWRDYRAATLILWLQGTRALEGLFGPPDEGGLADLASCSDSDIDALVYAFSEEYMLLSLNPPRNQLLYLPSSGGFPLPVEDLGCLTTKNFGLAVPIHPHAVLAAVPKGAVLSVESLTPRLPAYSVGVSRYADRVVIPPAMFEHFTENEICSFVTSFRSGNDAAHDALAQLREAVRDCYEEGGFETHLDSLNRLNLGPTPDPSQKAERQTS